MKVLLVLQNFVFVQELLVNCKDAIGGGKENMQLSLLLMTVLVDLAKLNYKPASGFFFTSNRHKEECSYPLLSF